MPRRSITWVLTGGKASGRRKTHSTCFQDFTAWAIVISRSCVHMAFHILTNLSSSTSRRR
eukprot:834595-Pyramimonas_sp.AAC.1